jgi:hypothetical protein
MLNQGTAPLDISTIELLLLIAYSVRPTCVNAVLGVVRRPFQFKGARRDMQYYLNKRACPERT